MLLRPVSQSITPHSEDNNGWRYVSEFGVTFRSLSLKVLLQEVYKHLFAMGRITHDWEMRVLDEMCQQNGYTCEGNPDDPDYLPPLVVEGRKLWAELHEYARSYPESPTEADVEAARQWFAEWSSRAPNVSSCNCKKNFAAKVEWRPPDFSSREAFWAWSISVHSDVSESIGKRRWRVLPDCQGEPE